MACLKRKLIEIKILDNEMDELESDESSNNREEVSFEERKLELEKLIKNDYGIVSDLIKSNNKIFEIYLESEKNKLETYLNTVKRFYQNLRVKLRILGKVILQFEHYLELDGIKSTDHALFECKNLKYLFDVMRRYETSTRYLALRTFEKVIDSYIIMLKKDKTRNNKEFVNDLLKFKYLYCKGKICMDSEAYNDKTKRRLIQFNSTRLSKDDLCRLDEYCDKEIMTCTMKIKENKHVSYTKVRKLLYTKLTFLNCKKSNELSTLTISEYMDSMNKVPVNKGGDEHPTDVSPLEKEYFYIIRFFNLDPASLLYMSFIPFFIPRKYKTVVTFLIDSNVRKQYDISNKNEFVFPSSRNSLEHIKGDLDIKKVCQMANLADITATSVRHYMAMTLEDDESISYKDKAKITALLNLNSMRNKRYNTKMKTLDLMFGEAFKDESISDYHKMFTCDESERLLFYFHVKAYFKDLTEDDVSQILAKYLLNLSDLIVHQSECIPKSVKNMGFNTSYGFILNSICKKEVLELKKLACDAFDFYLNFILEENLSTVANTLDESILNLFKQIIKEKFIKFTKGKSISEDLCTLVLVELANQWQDDIPNEDQVERWYR